MARAIGSAALLLAAFVLAPACGITTEGGLDSSDAGTEGGGGGSGGVSGTCFPGSKVCPDSKGELVCVDANTPSTGCSDSTGCSPCPLPHATAKCSADGQCLVDACDPGWQDCNGSAADGCETNSDGDHANCGSCGNDCKATKGQNWICEAGSCIVNYCDPDTLLDCDKDKSNGCEVDSNTDVKNCKFCGNACSLAHATNKCVSQVCKIEKCDAGWENCDGNEANGCETNVVTDPGNCGSCGAKCDATNGVPGCSAGKCAIVCSAPFGNCDGNVANGCETNTKTVAAHCGGCGKACNLAHATPACTNGACTIAGCDSGWEQCDSNQGNGCETNVASDPTHCGSCTKSCSAPNNATPTCASGNCGFDCNQNYSTCGAGNTCFNTLNDPSHCGSGCKTCPPPASGQGSAVCNSGTCGVTCKTGFTACSGNCFDLKVDPAHCGTCTKVCAAPTGGTTSCVNSACQGACPATLTLCAGTCVNTNVSGSHCGGCGNACSGGKVCAGGNCVCPPTKQDCGDGICRDCCGNGDCAGGWKCCGGGVCKASC